MKPLTILISLILILGIIGISGCTTNSSEQAKTPFYQGEWNVDTAHFVVKQDLIDAFTGSYKAYKDNGTIILEGTGVQMSIPNDTNHDIKIVMKQQGSDVNSTYYLDGKIHSYEIVRSFTVQENFDLTVKTWEMRLTTAEENKLSQLLDRTENIKV